MHRAPWNWIQTCSTLVSQAPPLYECILTFQVEFELLEGMQQQLEHQLDKHQVVCSKKANTGLCKTVQLQQVQSVFEY